MRLLNEIGGSFSKIVSNRLYAVIKPNRSMAASAHLGVGFWTRPVFRNSQMLESRSLLTRKRFYPFASGIKRGATLKSAIGLKATACSNYSLPVVSLKNPVLAAGPANLLTALDGWLVVLPQGAKNPVRPCVFGSCAINRLRGAPKTTQIV